MKAFINEKKFAASAQTLFQAFEDPALLAQWWGPNGFSNTFELFEFREGGKWKFVMHGPNGANYPNECIFQELVPSRKVVIRHDCAPFFTLTVTIKEAQGGSMLHWNQDFDSEEVAQAVAPIVEPANREVLAKLERVVVG
ncbi:MAG: SRPBCC domain-containing protein [Fibrobacteres bacterium]|nr:SRPBCC domain-containing protein [Fibrobacterota bacterium]